MALSRQSPAEAGLTTGSEPVEDPGFSGIRVRAGEPRTNATLFEPVA